MDIRIFKKKDGSIVQLIDKEKMQDWPIELPLIFVEYVRSKQLDSYGDVKKDVENYLIEITKDVAIPRLINVLGGKNTEEIILALTRILEIAKKNVEMAMPIKKYLDGLLKDKNKQVVKLAQDGLNEFLKAEKKKELAKKKKIMQQREKDFLEGKITGEEYAKVRKEYLILKE